MGKELKRIIMSNISGATKLWLSVFIGALIVITIKFIIPNWENRGVQNLVFCITFIYLFKTTVWLLFSYSKDSEKSFEWNENDIKLYCWFIPLFYIWIAIYYTNKLANKYL